MSNTLTLPAPTADDLAALVAFRQELHRHPELSGEEEATAAKVVEMLRPTAPDRILTGLGGHGVAAVFDSGRPGPTILFRSELDALPIEELGEVEHRSRAPGKAHLCGHDGHSTILVGMARVLSRARPTSGRVVLMFQPAEENGAGARAVVADARYGEIRPDWAFSLHNAPDVPFGSGKLVSGPANCASRGMWIELTGSTAHASRPGDGRSPMQAIAELMPALTALGTGGELKPGFKMVTVTHAQMGAPSYGVAPGAASIMATLRTVRDEEMEALVAAAEGLVTEAAGRHGLTSAFGYDDVFNASINDPEATEILGEAMARTGIARAPRSDLSIASEDFGEFALAGAKGAMVFLGAGPDWPAVHTPTYDFRDELIAQGIALFSATLVACLERA
ncbi:amidohydrolase [Pseudoroseicyclus tamaricis]|uniref:Amidohydrolase n=1 Tax=Pseudoroseicyclus tamaricis TaxID=2705421 RepID=A0A6B2K0K3_9RHOB|nr:amidohydrolase [Pseudoroseicyclus tamaricis]NDV01212.1 amidohydrolase [Pseudoroseicyclus tamaricis]